MSVADIKRVSEELALDNPNINILLRVEDGKLLFFTTGGLSNRRGNSYYD